MLTFPVVASLLGLLLAAVATFMVRAKRHSVEPAIVIAASSVVALVLLGVLGTARELYGWTLFVVAPFAMGFVAAALVAGLAFLVRVWDEATRLTFTIEEGPPVLREWTPYTDIHPPHLQGYFVPVTADFTLVPLADGGTRLLGTSVYRNRMWPSPYWRLWSDAIVTRVHRRVFQNIKQLAERDSAHSARSAASGLARLARQAGR